MNRVAFHITCQLQRKNVLLLFLLLVLISATPSPASCARVVECEVYSTWNRTTLKAMCADTPELWSGINLERHSESRNIINVYTREGLHAFICDPVAGQRDLLFIDRSNRIVFILERCSGIPRVISPEPVVAILSLPGGFVDSHKLELTHHVSYPRTSKVRDLSIDTETQRTEAIHQLTQFKSTQPDNESCLLNLAAHLLEDQEFTAVEELLNRGKTWQSDPVLATTLLAKAIALQGRFDEATALFEHALDQAPDRQTTVIFFDRTLKISRTVTQIETGYQRLLNKHPANIYLATSFCQFYLDRNMTDKAERLIEQQLKLDPENPTLHKFLGHINLRKGFHRAAAKAYLVYLNAKPFDLNIRDLSSYITVHLYRDDLLKKELSK